MYNRSEIQCTKQWDRLLVDFGYWDVFTALLQLLNGYFVLILDSRVVTWNPVHKSSSSVWYPSQHSILQRELDTTFKPQPCPALTGHYHAHMELKLLASAQKLSACMVCATVADLNSVSPITNGKCGRCYPNYQWQRVNTWQNCHHLDLLQAWGRHCLLRIETWEHALPTRDEILDLVWKKNSYGIYRLLADIGYSKGLGCFYSSAATVLQWLLCTYLIPEWVCSQVVDPYCSNVVTFFLPQVNLSVSLAGPILDTVSCNRN